MMGRIIQSASRFTGTATVGVEAAGQTVISVDRVTDFATDAGAISIGGTIAFYTSVDRNASTITLAAPLAAALPAGTDIRAYPYSVQRWAFVLPDTQDPADAVWALVPHALSAFIRPDGLRAVEDREQVKMEQDGTQMVVVDVLNRQPYLDPNSIPEGAITETKIEPGSITTPLIAANAVATQHLQAGAVKASTIDTDALNGKVITGALVRSAATGRRVELSSSGLVQVDENGNVLLSIGNNNKFTGEIDATSIVIRDSLQLFGKNNLFGAGSKITLKGSTTAPSQMPTLSWDYEQVTSPNFSPSGWFTTGAHADNGLLNPHTTEIFWQTGRYNAPNGVWTFPNITVNGNTVSEYKPWSMVRIAKGNDNALRTVMIGEDHTRIGANGYSEVWMRVYDTSTLVPNGSVAPVKKVETKFADFSFFRQYKLMRLINGATWKSQWGLVWLEAPLGGGPQSLSYAVFQYNDNDAGYTVNVNQNLGPVIPEGEVLAGAVYGMSDGMGLDGTPRPVMVVMTDKMNYVYNASNGTWETNAYWLPTYNTQSRAFVAGNTAGNNFDGFYSWNDATGTDQKFHKYANNHKFGENTIWGSFLWRGESTKTYRTQMSAQSSTAYRRMARLRVTVPSLPAPVAGVGAARDVDKDVYGWEYFLGTGVSAPSRTAMYLQSGQPSLAPGVATTVTTATLSTFPVLTGANPPVANTFPLASSATVESDTGGLVISGDGSIVALTYNGQTISDSGWQNISLNANWQHYANASNTGNGWGGAQYRLRNGILYLRGLVTKTTAVGGGDIMGTVPAGYRPSADFMLTVWTAGNQQARMEVGTNGNIYFPEGVPSPGYISLAAVVPLG